MIYLKYLISFILNSFGFLFFSTFLELFDGSLAVFVFMIVIYKFLDKIDNPNDLFKNNFYLIFSIISMFIFILISMYINIKYLESYNFIYIFLASFIYSIRIYLYYIGKVKEWTEKKEDNK